MKGDLCKIMRKISLSDINGESYKEKPPKPCSLLFYSGCCPGSSERLEIGPECWHDAERDIAKFPSSLRMEVMYLGHSGYEVTAPSLVLSMYLCLIIQ